jgi:hypothetical protein
MIGAMTTIICKRCGHSFETEATTNTRCRNCRAVVRVPPAAGTREHTFGVLLLSCGHPAIEVVHPGKSLTRILKQSEWECPDTGATVTATRVLGVLSEAEYENLTDETFDRLVLAGAGG